MTHRVTTLTRPHLVDPRSEPMTTAAPDLRPQLFAAYGQALAVASVVQ